jgi:hypothetical protein
VKKAPSHPYTCGELQHGFKPSTSTETKLIKIALGGKSGKLSLSKNSSKAEIFDITTKS